MELCIISHALRVVSLTAAMIPSPTCVVAKCGHGGLHTRTFEPRLHDLEWWLLISCVLWFATWFLLSRVLTAALLVYFGAADSGGQFGMLWCQDGSRYPRVALNLSALPDSF